MLASILEAVVSEDADGQEVAGGLHQHGLPRARERGAREVQAVAHAVGQQEAVPRAHGGLAGALPLQERGQLSEEGRAALGPAAVAEAVDTARAHGGRSGLAGCSQRLARQQRRVRMPLRQVHGLLRVERGCKHVGWVVKVFNTISTSFVRDRDPGILSTEILSTVSFQMFMFVFAA